MERGRDRRGEGGSEEIILCFSLTKETFRITESQCHLQLHCFTIREAETLSQIFWDLSQSFSISN
jgi:hypothetical protein